MTRHAWVLNLDADLELAAGPRYAPPRAVLDAMKPHAEQLAKTLLGPRDVMLEGAAPGDVGRAFCPTPRAIASMRAASVTPESYPAFEVLRRVNGRAFSAELGQTLPGAVFARSLDEARAVLAAPPPIGRQWRAKRAYGMAGRGQRPIGVLTDADVKFLAASIERDGGIQLEPEVAILRELAVHGMLETNGDLRLGRLVEQRCDASGQWLASAPTGEENPILVLEARRVAEALHLAGYFGPFGLDAFVHGGGLNPRSEINARYSMGFAASGLVGP